MPVVVHFMIREMVDEQVPASSYFWSVVVYYVFVTPFVATRRNYDVAGVLFAVFALFVLLSLVFGLSFVELSSRYVHGTVPVPSSAELSMIGIFLALSIGMAAFLVAWINNRVAIRTGKRARWFVGW